MEKKKQGDWVRGMLTSKSEIRLQGTILESVGVKHLFLTTQQIVDWNCRRTTILVNWMLLFIGIGKEFCPDRLKKDLWRGIGMKWL